MTTTPQPDPPDQPCGKRGYRTRKYAKRKLRTFRGRGLSGARGSIHVYFCEKGCGCWHIGHYGRRSRQEMRQDKKGKQP